MNHVRTVNQGQFGHFPLNPRFVVKQFSTASLKALIRSNQNKKDTKEDLIRGLIKDRDRDFLAMTTQKQQQQALESQQHMMKNSGMMMMMNSAVGSPLMNEDRDEEMTRSALAAFRAKEEEIERRKIEVREKVQAQLGRVEEETKRLAEIREELEALNDPMRKEVGIIRKRIDLINRDLKPLGMSCQKKEREYKEALEAFNEKNREKGILVAKLIELVSESEKLRLKKLEELCKSIDSLR